MGMINVKVVREHENEFGDKRAKTKGANYDAPALAAQMLKTLGFVTYTDTKAAREALVNAGAVVEADAAPDTAAAAS